MAQFGRSFPKRRNYGPIRHSRYSLESPNGTAATVLRDWFFGSTTPVTFTGTGFSDTAYGAGALTGNITLVGDGFNDTAYGVGTISAPPPITFTGTGIDGVAYGSGGLTENMVFVGTGVEYGALGAGVLIGNIILVGVGFTDTAYGAGYIPGPSAAGGLFVQRRQRRGSRLLR